MNKILYLDKDGTLVYPKSGEKFVKNPEDQILFPGVRKLVTRYIDEGYDPIIITNQGGVAAGHKTMPDAIAEVDYCLELLDLGTEKAALCPGFKGQSALVLDGEEDGWFTIYHSSVPNLKRFRKPDCGMLQLFLDDSVEYEHILFVGDRREDELAAKQMGCDFTWAKDWRAIQSVP